MLAFWIRADLDEAAFRGDELRGFGPAALAFKKEKLLKRVEDLRMVECCDCGNPHIEDVDVMYFPGGNRKMPLASDLSTTSPRGGG